MVWLAQDVPFQTAPVAAPAPASGPTASQNVTEAHDTWPTLCEIDAGSDCSCHDFPSHTSAKGAVVLEPRAVPVASQNLSETHDTPVSTASVEPDGPGADSSVQEFPLNRATSGTTAPEVLA
jgi:hypothetical protein